ncbi:conserved hypothetical protein [Nitrosomonas mobilis]|uniref:Uncharacterized protein n=1 Tax=Nitrosomonas mobilis TaxID=51642 RepID=A0A1G5SDR1_9PROT|nr:conserved hypothetical protein [Nitrosomonas mobilis]
MNVILSHYILDESHGVLPRLHHRLGSSNQEIRDFVESLETSYSHLRDVTDHSFLEHFWLQALITSLLVIRICSL